MHCVRVPQGERLKEISGIRRITVRGAEELLITSSKAIASTEPSLENSRQRAGLSLYVAEALQKKDGPRLFGSCANCDGTQICSGNMALSNFYCRMTDFTTPIL